MAQPFGGYDPSAIMSTDDPQVREQLMRQMGVANLDPPLPHSPCLKIIKTGRVLPWNELLAEQHDLVVCCDENGNTDEAAWKDKVQHNAPTNSELTIMAQQQIMRKQELQRDTYEHACPNPQLNKGPSEYEKQGVISFTDIRALRESLHEADNK